MNARSRDRALAIRKLIKFMSYPRSYSTKELEKEIDKYGEESPNSHLGPSYYARASLGLIELERRNAKWLGWSSLVVSIFALTFSIIAIRYAAEQTKLTEIQSRSERIQQARSINEAVKRCKESPELQESGLYGVETGQSATCSSVLKQYGN